MSGDNGIGSIYLARGMMENETDKVRKSLIVEGFKCWPSNLHYFIGGTGGDERFLGRGMI